MPGEVRHSRQVIELEYTAYLSRGDRAAKFRGKFKHHVAEIYAGEAIISRRAHLFGLRALQPVEARHGTEVNTKAELEDMYANVTKSTPFVTVIGIMCTVWSQLAVTNYY